MDRQAAEVTQIDDREYKKLSIDFYGGSNMFSKKESPLVAREIYCCAENCDLRDIGRCVRMRNSLHWLDPDWECPNGKVETHKGYTTRAKKYRSFRDKYEKDSAYETKLDTPDKYFFGHMDGYYVICYNWARLYKNETGWHVSHLTKPSFIPDDEFDIEKIYEMILYTGDRGSSQLKERNNTHIPLFLKAMEKGDPEKCGLLLMLHPDLGNYKLDVIGKKALLATLADGSVITLDKQKWTKQGNKLICDDYKAKHVYSAFAHGPVELEILPDYAIEVIDENWCDENTEFAS